MSKRDLGSKLKTRLGEWQAYGGQPVSPEEPHNGHAVTVQSEPVGNRASDGIVLVSVEETLREAIHIQMDPVQPEEKIAALQAALEHERDQSRRLLDVVAREQVLHAVTLKSQTQNRFTPGNPSPPSAWKTERPRETHITIPKTSRPSTFFILVALASVVGCAYLAYTWIKLIWPAH